jgi:glycosyltransferase involved in cell wall biosynthesis
VTTDAGLAQNDAALDGSPGGRDLFLVANNIDEIGGVQRIAHVLAELFSQRGNRVHLIGVREYQPRHDYMSPTAAYATHRLGVEEHLTLDDNQPTPADIAYLDQLFATVNDGIIICLQVNAMRWVSQTQHAHLHLIGQGHESFVASVGIRRTRASRFHRIKRYYRNADRFLSLTEPDAIRFRRAGLNNTGVMPNPVTIPPGPPADLTAPVLITLGRLAPEKNYPAFVDAFAAIAADFPDWSVQIYGDGPEGEDIQQHIDSRGLTDRVHLMGSTNDVAAALRDASIFVLSSRAEGLPLSLIEAMTCGLPSVAFNCSPGVHDMLADGASGILVPPGAVDRLAEGMRRLMLDHSLRRTMGASALGVAREFSADTVMARWEALFAEVER